VLNERTICITALASALFLFIPRELVESVRGL